MTDNGIDKLSTQPWPIRSKIACHAVAQFQDANARNTPRAGFALGKFYSSWLKQGGGQQVFDIPVAQIEPIIEPDGVLNDFGWKSMTFVLTIRYIHCAIVSQRPLICQYLASFYGSGGRISLRG